MNIAFIEEIYQLNEIIFIPRKQKNKNSLDNDWNCFRV